MADVFYGTGWRHKVQQWPKSQVTNRCHKTWFPDVPDTNKLVLVIEDSHLRSFVEGVVAVPGEHISFGYSCTPGATTEELRQEILGANIPLSPDLVVLLAPSNNLIANMTTTEAGKDFTRLMAAVLHHIQYQRHLRNEYHRAAARMGLKYLSVVDHFPLKHSKLWCKDGIHLSDNFGTPILADLLWASAYLELREFMSQTLPYRPPVFNPVIVECVRQTFSPKSYGPVLLGRIFKCFIPVMPVWSDILYSCLEANHTVTHTTTAICEANFKNTKNLYLNSKSRIDDCIEKLEKLYRAREIEMCDKVRLRIAKRKLKFNTS
uniref:Uncharacterized protein n=1 Tax=Astyanax mexicanus TaxID=7994 RepID=A0A3B1JIJ6_ASTMX